MCVIRENRTADSSKFVNHQDSPARMDKSDSGQNVIAMRESATPEFMIMDRI